MPEDENYYPEDSEPREVDSEDEGSGMEEGGVQTALIPKSLLMGKEFNPGDEVVFQIVHLYEDEVEIKYAPEKKKGKGDKDYDEEDKEMSPEDELDMMAQKGSEMGRGRMMRGGY